MLKMERRKDGPWTLGLACLYKKFSLSSVLVGGAQAAKKLEAAKDAHRQRRIAAVAEQALRREMQAQCPVSPANIRNRPKFDQDAERSIVCVCVCVRGCVHAAVYDCRVCA